MSYLLVAFGSDGTTGDSSFGPEAYGEYVNGMTFEDSKNVWMSEMRKSMDIKDCSADELEENGYVSPNQIVGFWLIDEKMHQVITNVNCDWGNDTAVYHGINVMKTQIESAAVGLIDEENNLPIL